MAAVAVAVVVGVGWAAWRAEVRLGEWLDPALAGQDQVVDGSVAGLPDAAAHGTRFLFSVEGGQPGIETAGGQDGAADRLPARLLLTWRDQPETLEKLEPGQRYRLTVRLRRPRGLANPHGFDYAYWLLGEGVSATGYVRHGQALPQHASPSLSIRIARWRARLRDHMREALPPGARYGAVLVALVIGDQRGIAQADWDVFRRTGISHLVRINGL